jgi:hypothetical protein
MAKRNTVRIEGNVGGVRIPIPYPIVVAVF